MGFRRRSLFITLCFFLLCLLGRLLTLHHIKETVEYLHITFGKHRCQASRENTSTGFRRKKLILFYTNIFGRIPMFQPDSYKCCQTFDCILSIDKSRVRESDAVIFHGRDMPNKMPTKGRNLKQRWIFYTLENPYHNKIEAKEYNNMFNWTMTYERRSHIFYPYGSYQMKENVEGYKPINFAAKKDKLVTFINSHCRTVDTIRENFIRALTKHIKVDTFGRCRGVFGRMMCPRNSKLCEYQVRQYKFTLAFENAQCIDYITEKYWNVALPLGLVPIVYGGEDFKDLAIPGSYIDASLFRDAEHLAKYLEYLDRNDTAYNEYFSWKKFYEEANIEPWPCRLCQMLHNTSLPMHTYKHFDTLLDPDLVCAKNRKHFQSYSLG